MTRKSIPLTAELHDYVVAHGTPPDPVLRDLLAETAALGGAAEMQVPPEEGALLTLLARLVGARDAVEVGTFTGYSSVCIARGLSPDGRLVCCDVSAEWTAVARRAWARAGLADRVELRLGPALDTLRAMPPEPLFDLAFLDADKQGYPAYWAELVPRVRSGGVLVVDNVLRDGRVLAPTAEDDVAVARFNDEVCADARVDAVLLPVADGVTIARRH
ncbi:MAG: O-methyltransferase [Actinomycetota bacterium]